MSTRERWNQASNKVNEHQGWEGRSTARGSQVYLDAYDAAGAYIRELEARLADVKVEIVKGGGPAIGRVWKDGILIFDGEDLRATMRDQLPRHMVSNGGMLHALADVSAPIQTSSKWADVSCKICLAQQPPIVDEMPPHQDYDGKCDHRAAYDAVVSHTVGTTDGPNYCVECSEALQEWVPWPCPRAERAGAKG